MIPSRTTVRLGIFLFFGSRRFGKIKINKHFRVCDLDAIYKGINDPAVIILGTFIRRDKELLQQEEDALDVSMAQRSELDYLIYNDPLGYADLILNGDTEKYLKTVTGSHGLED